MKVSKYIASAALTLTMAVAQQPTNEGYTYYSDDIISIPSNSAPEGEAGPKSSNPKPHSLGVGARKKKITTDDRRHPPAKGPMKHMGLALQRNIIPISPDPNTKGKSGPIPPVLKPRSLGLGAPKKKTTRNPPGRSSTLAAEATATKEPVPAYDRPPPGKVEMTRQSLRGHSASLRAKSTEQERKADEKLEADKFLETDVKELWRTKGDESMDASSSDSSSIAPQLFVQMGKECTLAKGEWDYELAVQDMNPQTWAFTDRPARGEKSMPTTFFVDNSGKEFGSDPPNGAVTFVDEYGEQHGPLVSIFIGAKYDEYDEDKLIVIYSLKQSADQESVISLQSFFDNGNMTVDDTVEFDDCSLFIDDVIGWAP